MYRCSACDSPAMLNCECFTQIELPTDDRPVHRPLQQSPLLLENLRRKKNISSGEDAIVEDYETIVVE